MQRPRDLLLNFLALEKVERLLGYSSETKSGTIFKGRIKPNEPTNFNVLLKYTKPDHMKALLTLLLLTLTFGSFAKEKLYKALDENGNILFTIEADYIYPFSDGLARYQKTQLINNAWVRGYGYLNTKGEVVIEPQYEKANDFVDGRAWVRKEGEKHWTLIDATGNVIPTKKYEKVGYIMEGYSQRIAVYEDGAMGWIDRNGKEVIPCKYLGSSTFDKEFGLACVTDAVGTDEKYGFIDTTGAVVIPFQYRQAGSSSFSNGYCRVNVGGKTVLIDEKGKVVFTPKYGSLQNISCGLMGVATKPARKGWGYLNLKNELVIPGIYDGGKDFEKEGWAIVDKNDLTGVIDTLGKEILPLKYESVLVTDEYICAVLPTSEPMSLKDSPKEYYTRNFEPLKLEGITLMSAEGGNLIPFMDNDGKRGFMDYEFNVVIPAQYSKSTVFANGVAFVVE